MPGNLNKMYLYEFHLRTGLIPPCNVVAKSRAGIIRTVMEAVKDGPYRLPWQELHAQMRISQKSQRNCTFVNLASERQGDTS